MESDSEKDIINGENSVEPVVQEEKPSENSVDVVLTPDDSISEDTPDTETKNPCILMKNIVSCAQRPDKDGELDYIIKDMSMEVYPGEIWGIYSDDPYQTEQAVEISANMRPYYSGKSRIGQIGTVQKKKTILPQLFYMDTPAMLYPNMTVLEELMYVTNTDPKQKVIQKQKEMLDLLIDTGFETVALSYVSSLLENERMLLMLLVAALSTSDILVCNISRFHLQQNQVVWLGKITDCIRKSGKTLVLATNQPKVIGMTCDHVLFLHEGVTKYSGPVDDLNKEADKVVCNIRDRDLDRFVDLVKTKMPGYYPEIQGVDLYIHNRSGNTWSATDFYRLLADNEMIPQSMRLTRGRLENAFMELILNDDL